jgi:hypothetical protein
MEARTQRWKGLRAHRPEERSEEMMHYGESDYWVAHYRSMTEGSAQQAHSAGDPRRGQVARSTTPLTVLFRRIVRRSVEKKADLDGRA